MDPSYSDGVLEVVGVTGSFHLARLQVGLSQGGVPLAQGRTVRLTLAAPVACQIDGEPWLQAQPCTITCSRRGTAVMLRHGGGGVPGARSGAPGAAGAGALGGQSEGAAGAAVAAANPGAAAAGPGVTLTEVLAWGEVQGVISRQQRDSLLTLAAAAARPGTASVALPMASGPGGAGGGGVLPVPVSHRPPAAATAHLADPSCDPAAAVHTL